MNKIRLSSDDVDYILAWRDEHQDLVRQGLSPLKAVKMLFPETGFTVTAIRNGKALSFSITQKGKSLGRLFYTVQKNGLCALTGDTTRLSEENKQSVLTVYASTMALLVFGRTTIESDAEPREIEPATLYDEPMTPRKRREKGYTYILRKCNDSGRGGHHRSPRGQFSVRGHYRHYRNGKTVWIAEYTKGAGKKLATKYRLGKEA